MKKRLERVEKNKDRVGKEDRPDVMRPPDFSSRNSRALIKKNRRGVKTGK